MTFWRTPGRVHSYRTAALTACMRWGAHDHAHLQSCLQPLTCSRLWHTCQAAHKSQNMDWNPTWWIN